MNKIDIKFVRRLALQTLNNFDTLSINDIKRRLTDIIEGLEDDTGVQYESQ